MKTAVETVFVGKDRLYNRRFLQLCSHHLVDPVACTPAAGWEKGCESAWNKDPVFGVIGIQSGPRG